MLLIAISILDDPSIFKLLDARGTATIIAS